MNAKLEVTDEDTPLSKLSVAQLNKPAGVYFSATGNGLIEVEAYKSEPGTYVASFSVTDGFNESNLVEVTIIVEPADSDESADESTNAVSGSDGSSESVPESGNNILIIVIASAGALVILVAAVLIIQRTKNNKPHKGAQS